MKLHLRAGFSSLRISECLVKDIGYPLQYMKSITLDVAYTDGVEITYCNENGSESYQSINSTQVKDAIESYIQYARNNTQIVSVKNMLAIKEVIGFVPVIGPVMDGSLYGYCDYVPGLEFSTLEEFAAREKPIEYGYFMKFRMPKAIINNIRIIGQMEDSGTKIPEKIKELMAPVPELAQHAKPAIRKLISMVELPTQTPTPVQLTIDDLLVYDFLDILHLFDGTPRFVHGDVLLEDTFVNRVFSGNIKPAAYKYTLPPDREYIERLDSLPNSVIETSPIYTSFCRDIKHIVGITDANKKIQNIVRYRIRCMGIITEKFVAKK
jgi:hypothetical protein